MAKPVSARIRDALDEQWARRVQSVVALELPFPLSTNRLWRPARGTMVRTEAYRVWRQGAGAEINRQRPGRVKGPFTARIVLQRKEGRNRIDADNGLKCLLDILQHHKIIDNDKLAVEVNVSWSENVKGAQVVLTAVSGSAVRRAAA